MLFLPLILISRLRVPSHKLINRHKKEHHKFRIVTMNRSLGLLAEDKENRMKVELANNNNICPKPNHKLLKSTILATPHLTDKFIK